MAPQKVSGIVAYPLKLKQAAAPRAQAAPVADQMHRYVAPLVEC